MNQGYIGLLKKGTVQYRVRKVVFQFLVFAVTVGGGISLLKGQLWSNIVMLLIMYLILGVFYWSHRSEFRPFSYWINIIENEPEQVVWLKPIQIDHTAYFLVTYARSYKYELFLKNGDKLKVMCPNDKREDFVQIFQKYTPHVHFGYSKKVAKFYQKDKSTFLENIKNAGIYLPISNK